MNWAWIALGVGIGLMTAAVAVFGYIIWLAYELWKRS